MSNQNSNNLVLYQEVRGLLLALTGRDIAKEPEFFVTVLNVLSMIQNDPKARMEIIKSPPPLPNHSPHQPQGEEYDPFKESIKPKEEKEMSKEEALKIINHPSTSFWLKNQAANRLIDLNSLGE